MPRLTEVQLSFLYFDGQADGYERVEDIVLGMDGGASSCFIFKDLSSNRFYRCWYRKWRYYSDERCAFDTELDEVELKEVVVKKWILKV